MIVDAATLADMKQEADDLWARHKEAEKQMNESDVGVKCSELLKHWHVARRRVEAMDLLLSTAISDPSAEVTGLV